MTQLKELLDREARRVEANPDALGSVLRARDARQRNRRIGAAILALSITGLVVTLLVGAIRVQESVSVGNPLPYHHNGEIAVRADIGDGEGAIIQIDPVTGREITLPVAAPSGSLGLPITDARDVTDLWWSPDGKELAYLWNEALLVLDIASGDSRTIVASCSASCDLAWSPDGTRIAVTNASTIELLNAYGSDKRRVKTLGGDRYVHAPAWTPDGERILFAVETNTGGLPGEGARRRELYEIDRDGSGMTLLDEHTFHSRECCNLVAWSPDRARIAYFTWERHDGALEWTVGVAVADIDGSDRTELRKVGLCCDPRMRFFPWLGWSPDGTQLALVVPGPQQQQGLYVMNADGTDLQLVREGVHGRPAWRPVARARPSTTADILEGVAVDVSSTDLEPERTPEEIARIALDAIAAYEDQVGRALAPPRLVSITLVAPGEVFGSASQTDGWWGVRFEGTIAMWGGSDAPAFFAYPRGVFGVADATAEILFESVEGTPCFVSSESGEPPPGFEDTPAC